MAITSLPTQEFAQDVYKALNATKSGPVHITDCGIDTHVLLSYVDYQRLLARGGNIAHSLAMPEEADLEFEIPRVNIKLRPADFS
ncbi:type II toxin-antitoxin system Phd/YefM family antitoxin [Herbaspirillum huttiense]|uniref:type II toxin-antitoxin system Phd/YefM family antitoxin n=1 Tax=Herbaspirillum huttiense TaxID=863372 RepID=UPI002176BD14|nr:type II toxin-antitoxin system Phd/YefM family antitoxin [Herbaspirillum huttiense]UWE16087.1 type II toxin-antitoxin system Phd/YefM family antitoxin [Herbaspirillum huttiense]